MRRKKPTKPTKNKHKGPRPFTVLGAAMSDITSPIPLPWSKGDVTGATPKDPRNCIHARCINRTLPIVTLDGSHDKWQCMKGAEVYHRIARVPVKNLRTGEERWARGILSAPAQREAMIFDREGRHPDEIPGMLIKPPPVRQRLGARTGANSPGARDRGSRDRTPSYKRKPKAYIEDVRISAPTHPS